jgi:hypothetical protein
VRGSLVVEGDEENLKELRLRYETFEKSLPMLRNLEIL